MNLPPFGLEQIFFRGESILVYTLGPFSVERRQPDGTYQSVSLITSGPVTYESHTKSLLGYLLCCSTREHGKADDALKYYKDAAKKLGKVEQLPSGVVVPARIAAEIEIAKTQAYALEGNMEGFLTSFEKGVRQAKVLGSEKRKQEARDALKIAIGRWSREQRVTGLWELLV